MNMEYYRYYDNEFEHFYRIDGDHVIRAVLKTPNKQSRITVGVYMMRRPQFDVLFRKAEIAGGSQFRPRFEQITKKRWEKVLEEVFKIMRIKWNT